MDRNSDLILEESQNRSSRSIEDLCNILNLDEVVPRAQSAELAAATVVRSIRDQIRICTFHTAPRLQEFEIPGSTQTGVDGPFGTQIQDASQCPSIESEIGSPLAHTGWNTVKQPGYQLGYPILNIDATQT